MARTSHHRLLGILRVIALPVVLATVALMVAYAMAEQAFSTFFPAYAERELGSMAVRSGLYTSLFWAGMGAGRLTAAAEHSSRLRCASRL